MKILEKAYFWKYYGSSTNKSCHYRAGTVAEYAARTALGLGAHVKVFDNSITKLRRLQNTLNQRIFTSTIQEKSLLKALRRCDMLLLAP